jgi:hypothetical protein
MLTSIIFLYEVDKKKYRKSLNNIPSVMQTNELQRNDVAMKSWLLSSSFTHASVRCFST